MMTFSEVDSFKISTTSSHTSAAYSSSVPVKLSGEYSKSHSVSFTFSDNCLIKWAPFVAISFTPSLSELKTTFRCSVDVEL